MALKWEAQVTVVLSPAKFAALTMSPTGDIHQFTKRMGNAANSFSRVLAPQRTGELKRKIYSRNPKANATSVYVHVECSAKHAYWVHEGTDAIVNVRLPAEGGMVGGMVLYAGVLNGSRPRSAAISKGGPLSKGGVFTDSIGHRVDWVSGQAAQPFMGQALDFVKRQYGLT